MDKRLQMVIAVAIVAAAVTLAVVTRYEYVHLVGGRIRIDRWTGARQVWECTQIDFARELKVPPWSATPTSPYDPIFKGKSQRPPGCAWVRR